jgi:poly(A) polymerase
VRPEPIRRLAALAVSVEDDAERLQERLRLSNQETRRLSRYGMLVPVLKSWPHPIDAAAVRRLVAEHGIEAVVDALAALAGEGRPEIRDDALPALDRYFAGSDAIPAFPLRGADLLAGGIPPGRAMGELLEEARQAWLAAGCPTDPGFAEALLRQALGRRAAAEAAGQAN